MRRTLIALAVAGPIALAGCGGSKGGPEAKPVGTHQVDPVPTSPAKESPRKAVPEYTYKKASGRVAEGEGVRLTLGKMEVKTVTEGIMEPKQSKEKYLVITVTIESTDPNKKIDAGSWTNDLSENVATDEHGNKYRFQGGILSNIQGIRRSVVVRPGEKAENLIILDRPIDTAKRLTLKLSGKPVGAGSGFVFDLDLGDVAR